MKNEEIDEGKNPLMDAAQLEIELEKKKIREEIIASDFVRRQKLEAEVRMELMMEKQIMGMRRFRRDLSVFDDPYNTSTSTMLMNSGLLGYQGPLFHKNLLNVGSSEGDFGDRLKLIGTSVGGVDDLQQIKSGLIESNVFRVGEQQQHGVALGKMPFEPNSSLGAVQIAGKSADGLSGEEVFGQVMSSSGITGMKRKAETSVPSEETASVASKELQKKKWYCSLCGVSATSAGGLNLHLHGKKHKAKEALAKFHETASNVSMDSTKNLMQHAEQAKAYLQSMEEQKTQAQSMEEDDNEVKPMEEDKSQAQPVEGDKIQLQFVEKEKTQLTKKWECSLCQVFATSEILLRSHLQGKKHKAKEAKLEMSRVLSEAKEKGEVAHKWYCSLCKVSAASEKNLNDHFQGKKHKAKAGLLPQEADSVESNLTEKVSEDMNIVQEKSSEGDKIISNEQATVDTSSPKTGSDEDTSNNNAKKQKINNEDIIETEESEEAGQDMVQDLVKVWSCKICNEETEDEAAMANHRKSGEHMAKLRKTGGGLIVVSSQLKEAVESEKDSENAAL